VRSAIGTAGGALVITAVVAVAAKIAGVILAPAARGLFTSNTVNAVEWASGAFAYALTALLVALVCGASFDLARARSVHGAARGGIVAATGLVVALASPAVVERLSAPPTVILAVISSMVALVAGAVVVRAPQTRAVGGILVLLAICGLARLVAWETSTIAFDRGNVSLRDAARVFATVGVGLQAIAALLAAMWIGTRAGWRGRILANVAIILAFAATWIAGRASDSPSALEAVLRISLSTAAGMPSPYHLGAIAAFLVPASILLAAVALVQPGRPALLAALSLALLSHGAFDVPLQALLVTASAQWAILAMIDQRGLVQQPTS
jgi:hypothetical protein